MLETESRRAKRYLALSSKLRHAPGWTEWTAPRPSSQVQLGAWGAKSTHFLIGRTCIMLSLVEAAAPRDARAAPYSTRTTTTTRDTHTDSPTHATTVGDGRPRPCGHGTVHQAPPSRMLAGCGLLRHRQAAVPLPPLQRRRVVCCVLRARCAVRCARCASALAGLRAAAAGARTAAQRRASRARGPPCTWSARRRSPPRPASRTWQRGEAGLDRGGGALVHSGPLCSTLLYSGRLTC